MLHHPRSLSGRIYLTVNLLVLLLVILLGYEKCYRHYEQELNHVYQDLEYTAAEMDRAVSSLWLQIQVLENDPGHHYDEKISALNAILKPVLEDLSRRSEVSLCYYSYALKSDIAVVPANGVSTVAESVETNPGAVELCLQENRHASAPPTFPGGKQVSYTLPVHRKGQRVGLIKATVLKSYYDLIFTDGMFLDIGLLLLILAAGICCALYISRTIRAATALLGAHLDSFHEHPPCHVVPTTIMEEIPAEFIPLFKKYSQMAGRIQELVRELALSVRLSAFGETIVVIAHEIRNPLAIIKAATEIGMVTTDPEQQQLLFGRIDNAGDNINALLNRYLALARDPLNVNEEINVQLALEEVLSMLQPLFRKKGIRLKSSYPIDAPLIIGDRLALKQALMNLIVNAVEASPVQGLITLGLFVSDVAVELRLSDSGPGIPHEIRHQIFNRFFTTKGDRGVGIGLALASSIIRKHGGKIWFESKEDYGTTFIVQLPAVDENIFSNQKDMAVAERID